MPSHGVYGGGEEGFHLCVLHCDDFKDSVYAALALEDHCVEAVVGEGDVLDAVTPLVVYFSEVFDLVEPRGAVGGNFDDFGDQGAEGGGRPVDFVFVGVRGSDRKVEHRVGRHGEGGEVVDRLDVGKGLAAEGGG